jgi:hypothetical protein
VAPGLLQAGSAAAVEQQSGQSSVRGQSGIWFRRGDKIVLQGV